MSSNMSITAINLRFLLFEIYPFRVGLFNILGATDMSSCKKVFGLTLSNKERMKYLNPVRDLEYMDQAIEIARESDSKMILLGMDTGSLITRVRYPERRPKNGYLTFVVVFDARGAGDFVRMISYATIIRILKKLATTVTTIPDDKIIMSFMTDHPYRLVFSTRRGFAPRSYFDANLNTMRDWNILDLGLDLSMHTSVIDLMRNPYEAVIIDPISKLGDLDSIVQMALGKLTDVTDTINITYEPLGDCDLKLDFNID